MKKIEQLQYLVEVLLNEMPAYKKEAQKIPLDLDAQRQLFRSLMNLRHPGPLSKEFLTVQNVFLQAETEEKGIVDVRDFSQMGRYPISVWQGDITRLQVDAIVNAANAELLGCFYPCHGCIDNAIHSAAGLQLRNACAAIMEAQGHLEAAGNAQITDGYNLPCKYVLHTVGPIVNGQVTRKDCLKLAACYRSCLLLAEKQKLKSIAFCCISTGEYHFPQKKAAEIAVDTIRKYFIETNSSIQVVFNVFKESDYEIYSTLLA
jgi:O-acetyl-ADP-ribose deacetylase (regulator of RNase III)